MHTIYYVGHGFYIIPYTMRPGQSPNDIRPQFRGDWIYVDVEAAKNDSRIPSDVAWYHGGFV
jgi:hypothetical protein